MYFVGKKQIKITRNKKRLILDIGEKIPEAKDWPSLRECLKRGEVTCDYKGGERKEEHLQFALNTSPSRSDMLTRLREAGVQVPLDASFQEICKAYSYSHLKMDLADGLPKWMAIEEPKQPKTKTKTKTKNKGMSSGLLL